MRLAMVVLVLDGMCRMRWADNRETRCDCGEAPVARGFRCRSRRKKKMNGCSI